MIELLAPAKLTVSLRLTGVRPDGYHLIDAEMVSLDLCDRLWMSPGRGVEMRGRYAGELAGPTDGTDLVSKALRLIGHEASVVVEKNIPAGAGLGGGSSDAAAILRWANFDDLAAAAELGADVAYCLVGGRARVRGIGDIVEPLDERRQTFTLVTPPVHCSTPVVYRVWDELGGPTAPMDAVEPNDLTEAALMAFPEIARWRDELAEASGLTPRLAGSGSTWFVEGSFPGAGRQVVTTLS
ncbi:MAG: 4-(cytidine 5'-diphospho)-2-C-methyl-D-erythritol kinase [Microthrixaceae bacterium]|nr:4-(cytidine 5'-diphospho)-2-C-methyl-D-erythritol kinase [Microthrixaceae bacterium]